MNTARLSRIREDILAVTHGLWTLGHPEIAQELERVMSTGAAIAESEFLLTGRSGDISVEAADVLISDLFGPSSTAAGMAGLIGAYMARYSTCEGALYALFDDEITDPCPRDAAGVLAEMLAKRIVTRKPSGFFAETTIDPEDLRDLGV